MLIAWVRKGACMVWEGGAFRWFFHRCRGHGAQGGLELRAPALHRTLKGLISAAAWGGVGLEGLQRLCGVSGVQGLMGFMVSYVPWAALRLGADNLTNLRRIAEGFREGTEQLMSGLAPKPAPYQNQCRVLFLVCVS